MFLRQRRDSRTTHYLSPPSSGHTPLRMLLFDSWFDQYRGVICLMAVTDGAVSRGRHVHMIEGLVYIYRENIRKQSVRSEGQGVSMETGKHQKNTYKLGTTS